MKIGKTDIQISRQGLGCMGMSEFYGKPVMQTEGINLIKVAYQNGVNFFDTADIYDFGNNEILVGNAITALLSEGVKRKEIVIATKCGILRDKNDVTKRGTDNSYDYVKTACDASLERLGDVVGYIDLFYLHRIANNGAQLDEAMQAMSELLAAGKIQAVGLSEANAQMIQSANDALLKYSNNQHQIAAVQTEYSLMTRVAEQNGVLDVCRKLGITFIAYSPLSRALLTGRINDVEQLAANDFRRQLPRFQADNLEINKKIVAEVSQIANRKKCSTAQVALAWVMAQPSVIPIPGTTKVENLLANIQSESITLNIEELNQLNSLKQAKGFRYTEAAMKAYSFTDEMNTRETKD